MSTPDLLAAVFVVLVWSTFAWLHGFHRGRVDMQRQVVESLHLSSQLRRANGRAIGSHHYVAADAVDQAADRVERWQP